MTTWEYAHQRTRSTARRLNDWLRPRLKSARDVLRAARRVAWPVAGAGCFVAGAFTVSILVGLIVAGLACFFLEWRFAR